MPVKPETAARLDHLVARAQREGRLPSVVAAVVRQGSLVWQGAVGTLDGRSGGEPADEDTQYRMGSITKTFVAVCVMRLRDAGGLELTDRFEEHVPGSQLGALTLEQLLTHAGGAQAETDGPWWERTPGGDWDALTASGVGQRFRAGRRFHYSNVGYAALGRLLEVRHGRAWFDVVRDELLAPLGMTRTTERPTGRAAHGLAVHPFADLLLAEPEHDAGAMAPAGQLWTTAADLARWATFLGGDTAGLLDPETLAEMCEPHHIVDEPGQPWTGAHGLGWQVWNDNGVRSAGHGGSMPGFLAGLRVRLDDGGRRGAGDDGVGAARGDGVGAARGDGVGAARGDGVVTMANTTWTSVLRALGDDLLRALAEGEPATVEPWSASGDPALLELVGTWHWGPSTTMATVRGEHLVLGEPGQARGARFRRVDAHTWVGLDGYHAGEPLRVVRRRDGSVSHLDLASFRFTRTPYDPDADPPGGVEESGWR